MRQLTFIRENKMNAVEDSSAALAQKATYGLQGLKMADSNIENERYTCMLRRY